MNIETLNKLTDDLKTDVAKRRGNCEGIQKRIDRQVEEQQALVIQQTEARKASLLVEQAANEARQGVKERFEGVAGAALRPVFGDDYGFEIIIEEKKNGTFAYCAITNAENHEAFDPLLSKGGSTIDVASIALRMAYLEESGAPGPLILDEPAKMVSQQQIEATARTIETLQKLTGRQIIMVTHHAAFKSVFPAALDLDGI